MKLTDEQVAHLVEYALKGARPEMANARVGYNRADKIAEGIARGIRNGLAEMGLYDREA